MSNIVKDIELVPDGVITARIAELELLVNETREYLNHLKTKQLEYLNEQQRRKFP